MNIYNIAVIGYLLILIVCIYHLKEHFKHTSLFWGFIIMSMGYLLLLINYYNKSLSSSHHDIDNNNIKINKGHLILFLLHFVNLWFKILEPELIIDHIALFGHLLLITNKFNKYGYIFSIIYYILLSYYYLIMSKEKNTISYIKVIGCILVSIFYSYEFYESIKEKLIDNKDKSIKKH